MVGFTQGSEKREEPAADGCLPGALERVSAFLLGSVRCVLAPLYEGRVRRLERGSGMSEATWPRNGNGSDLGDSRVKQAQMQVPTLLLTRGAESPTGWSRRNRAPFEAQSEAVPSTGRLSSHGSPPPPCRGGCSSVTLEPGAYTGSHNHPPLYWLRTLGQNPSPL